MKTTRILGAATVLAAMATCAMACSSSGGGSSATTGTMDCQPPGSTGTYLTGSTCGTEVGDTIANLAFKGRASGITSPQVTMQLSDWYDPDGKKGLTYLVIDVSALWCTYCKEEAPQIAGMAAKYGPKGVVFFTDVAQDANRNNATDADVDAWIQTYKMVTPVGTDPNFALGAFFDPNSMPLNMIIDLRTMTIVKKITGEGLPQVQAELDSRLGTM
jgi:thiol-disulfide isomerase/thioredoxin